MSEQQTSIINSTISSGKARAIMKVSTEVGSITSKDPPVLDEGSNQTMGKIATLPTSDGRPTDVQGSTPTSPQPLTFVHHTSLFTKREDFIVSSILRYSQFPSQAIKRLMIDKKLRSFDKVVSLTQDEWHQMVSPNDMILDSFNFLKIVVFQTWWGLQPKNSPMGHAFMFRTKDYDSIMDENFQ